MSIFEDLSFTVLEEPVTHENALKILTTISAFEDMDLLKDPALSDFLASLADAEFCMAGKVSTVRPILTNPVTKEHFLYIQGLSVNYMDDRYYTHRHSGDSHLLLYTLSGQGQVDYEGKTYFLSPGDGVWVDCQNDTRYRTVGSHWDHVALHVCGSNIEPLYREYLTAHPPCFYQEPGGPFQRCLENVIREYGDLDFGREIRIADGLFHMLTLLVSSAEESQGKKDGVLSELQVVIDHLGEHLSDPITLDELAELSHISKFHLSHEFKRLTGYSPIEYLNNLRFTQACALLQSTNLPVKRIAEIVGIPNNQHFGKMFKKKTGLTPGQYRNSL